MNGANFRAAYQPTDFALLELSTTPTLATYAGWQRTTYSSNIGVGIHHPAGDVKKISFDNDLLTSYNDYLTWSPCLCTTPPNTHWRIDFDQGTAQGGSSGSPIFNQNHRIVGQLHGGDDGCPSPPIVKYYGRFDKSWTGGGTNDTRLRNWLDPLNSGVLCLDTKYSTSATLSGPTLVCSAGAAYTVSNVPAGCTIIWTPGPNLNRISAQGSNPCTFSSTGNSLSWIRVTINSNNGIVTLPKYYVWAGTPVFNSISGPSSTPNYQWATFYAEPNNPHAEATNYTWILNTLNGNSVYPYGRSVDIAFYNSGYYQLVVRAQNTCGTGPYYWRGVYVYDSYYLMISPNPATNETTITIVSDSDKNFDETAEWEMEIYSLTQILIEKKTKLKGQSTKIYTSSWKKGIYIVRVKYKDVLLNARLLVGKE